MVCTGGCLLIAACLRQQRAGNDRNLPDCGTALSHSRLWPVLCKNVVGGLQAGPGGRLQTQRPASDLATAGLAGGECSQTPQQAAPGAVLQEGPPKLCGSLLWGTQQQVGGWEGAPWKSLQTQEELVGDPGGPGDHGQAEAGGPGAQVQ